MGGTILVVDDDPWVREVLVIALASEGHEVLEAADGRDALEVLESRRPDLILLDLMMPRMGGTEFVAELERRGLRSRIPIVVLSAAAHVPEQAARIGVEGYFSKPFELDALLDEVSRLTQVC
jgi:CheY-like chemotaxis protein